MHYISTLTDIVGLFRLLEVLNSRQFVDNMCSVLRMYKTRKNCTYFEMIKHRVIEV